MQGSIEHRELVDRCKVRKNLANCDIAHWDVFEKA